MYWMRSYYPLGYESTWCSAIRCTEDGGYLLAGTASFSQFATGFLLVKLPYNGQIEWWKCYNPLPSLGRVTCLEVVGTDCYVGGFTLDAGRTAAVVMKVDSASGEMYWTRLYGAQQAHTLPSALHKRDENRVALAGRYETLESASQHFWYVGLDADGGVETHRTYDYCYLDGSSVKRAQGTGIDIAPSGGDRWLLGGNLTFPDDPSNLWLVEVTQDGDLCSYMRTGGMHDDQMTAMQQVDDPSLHPTFVLCGFTRYSSMGQFDMMVIKLQLVAQLGGLVKKGIMWSKAYQFQGASHAYDLAQTTDGDLIVVGSAVTSTDSLDGVIVKLNSSDGMVQWVRGYGSHQRADGLYTVQPTPADNGFVTAGYNTGYPIREFIDPFTNQVRKQRNFWALALDAQANSSDDDSCTRVELPMPVPRDLDWDPHCNQPPEPTMDHPPLAVRSLEPTRSELVLTERLICE